MKKLFLFTTGVLVAIIMLLSFADSNSKTITTTAAVSTAISCDPAAAAVPAIPFENLYNPPVVMVRKNVYSLTAAEITSIKTGITNMKALPHTNPTSWLYQAAIHGTTLPDNLPSWNTCHKAGDAFFFLAWHRMYVYFFERILRAKSGNPNLTLPYWNYQTNAVMPPDYRSNVAGNTLYDASRNASMNGGGSLSASIMTSIENALDEVPYYDFQSGINGPHGSVHGAIGGNMSSVSSAAKDPVFWLHHCNIDRLWEEWLRKCGGRINPTDAAWLNKTYTFFDETGTAVNMTGSQVVNTATQLNYRYDFPPKLACGIIIKKWYIYKRWPLIRYPIPLTINKQLLKSSFRQAKPENLDNFIKTRNKERFSFTDNETTDKFIIEIESIKVDKLPEGVVEVYLNLAPNEAPNPKSKSFVGLLDLFSATHAASHHRMADKNTIELNASKAARALGLSIADLKNAEVSFFVRGNNLQGREVSTNSNIRAEGISFAVDIAQK
jgi:hypothetical protein